MKSPEYRITNQAEFKVNPDSEKDFSKIYEEPSEDEVFL